MTAVRRDGSKFPVEVSLSSIETRVGRQTVAFVSEITERKRSEQALRESEERFRATFEQAAVGIALVSLEGRWLRINDRLCEIAGYQRHELLSGSFEDITHPEDLATDWKYARALLAGEISTYSMEKRYVRCDRSFVWVNLTVSLSRDSQGEPQYFISVIEDIEARKRAEQEIRELAANLERRVEERTKQLEFANRELDTFAYSVSHDLRAPLRAIDGYSRALAEDYTGKGLDAEGERLIEKVRAGAARMGQLIEDLLRLSRVSRTQMRFSDTDLSDIAQQVIQELRRAEPERCVTVSIRAGMHARGDERLLDIVLENLIGNAWKFTSKRTQAKIEFLSEKHNGKATFCVRDNGAGFNMAYASQLFAPFQRLHRHVEFPGTGVGLATVQRIVLRHGGQIWAEAEKDKGAAFYFTLPTQGEPVA